MAGVVLDARVRFLMRWREAPRTCNAPRTRARAAPSAWRPSRRRGASLRSSPLATRRPWPFWTPRPAPPRSCAASWLSSGASKDEFDPPQGDFSPTRRLRLAVDRPQRIRVFWSRGGRGAPRPKVRGLRPDRAGDARGAHGDRERLARSAEGRPRDVVLPALLARPPGQRALTTVAHAVRSERRPRPARVAPRVVVSARAAGSAGRRRAGATRPPSRLRKARARSS